MEVKEHLNLKHFCASSAKWKLFGFACEFNLLYKQSYATQSVG